MPSIELLGYGKAEREKIEEAIRKDLADLDFYNEIVFVAYHAEVNDIRGNKQTYLRVCTRNESKAGVLMARLMKYADVEFIKSADIVMKSK